MITALCATSGGALMIAGLIGIPVTIYAIAVMIVALVIISKTAKLHPEFERAGMLGGIAALAYPILALMTAGASSKMLWVKPGLEMVTLWLFNPFTFGVALLVIHTIVIRKAKALLNS